MSYIGQVPSTTFHSGTNTFTGDIKLEGATANDHETSLSVVDPTADRTITLPNASGTIGELLITSGSVSNVASIDFNSSIITTDFKSYRVEVFNLSAATDTAHAQFRLGYQNSADATASLYRYSSYHAGGYASDASYNAGWTQSTGDEKVVLNSATYARLSGATGEHAHFQIELPNATNTSSYKMFRASDSVLLSYWPMWQSPYFSNGYVNSTTYRDNALNYFSFFLSTGNIASADYRVFGKI